MIKLYTFPPAFGLRNVSPFCLKVEMALKHLELDYQIIEISNPANSPKGKLPFVDIDGERVPDSELILKALDAKSDGALFSGLSAAQKAQGCAYVRLAEDHLYWIMVASRWLDDAWWPNVQQGFFGSIPAPVRQLISSIARRRMRQTYLLHGLGKHTLEEQQAFARDDLQALNDAVTENSFLLGEELTVYDFSVAALMAGLLDNQPETWLGKIAKEYEALVDYTDRVQAATGIYGRNC